MTAITSPRGGVIIYLRDGIGFPTLTLGALGLTICFLLARIVYRIYFHRLAKYPGPKLAAATRLWYISKMATGRLVFEIDEAHKKYGPVVRTAPNELSFISAAAWNDIYGSRSGKPEMTKETPFFTSPFSPGGILSAKKEKHAHLRRLMSRGFSEAALREQESIIIGYTDLFMRRLHEHAEQGKTVEMTSWYNFFTFDIIGDLAFGEPFGCLESSSYHPWVKMIFDSMRFVYFNQALAYYPKLQGLLPIILPLIMPKALSRKAEAHRKMTVEKVMRRKASKVDRADFVSNLIKPENNVSDRDLIDTCSILIIAGSETTATALSAVTFFLTHNPEALSKLVDEIRSRFNDVSEINFVSVGQLKYMLACLNEALRLFSPAPTGLARLVPAGGDYIDGNWVAGGIDVCVHNYPTNLSTTNFLNPTEFIPERWMGDSRFANDNRNAMQPFSTGPRNCIGQNLAYVEMRLVLARLLWEFDIEACEGQEKWNQVNIFLVWEKKPLNLSLKKVLRT